MPRQFKKTDTSIWTEQFGTGKDGDLTVSTNATFQVASGPFSTNANAFGFFYWNFWEYFRNCDR